MSGLFPIIFSRLLKLLLKKIKMFVFCLISGLLQSMSIENYMFFMLFTPVAYRLILILKNCFCFTTGFNVSGKLCVLETEVLPDKPKIYINRALSPNYG